MHRFRTPELFLGCLLTIAVFASGMLFVHWPYPQQEGQQATQQGVAHQGSNTQSPDPDLAGSTWLTKDAAGFFTFVLVVVGGFQALMFLVQLRYMRKGMEDATTAAKAAKISADAAIKSAEVAERSLTELERPWIFVFNLSRPSNEFRDDFFVEYTIANYGKMPAIIETPCIGFVLSDANGLPQTPMYPSEDHSLVAAPIMKAGEERRIREYFPTNPQNPVAFQILNEGTSDQTLVAIPSVDLSPDLLLFFRAEVSYRGPSSKGHKTGANCALSRTVGFCLSRRRIQLH
jgi:hypothetical protein